MELLFIRNEPVDSRTSPGLSLERILQRRDHKVSLLLPLLDPEDPALRSFARRLITVQVELDGETHELSILTGRDRDGIERTYLAHPGFEGGLDEAHEILFARAAVNYLGENESVVDIVYGADHVGALALRQLQIEDDAAIRILLVHDSPIPEKDALLAADAIFASREALLDAVDAALGDDRAERILRLLTPSLDQAEWNPLTDPALKSRFDPLDLRGKAACKTALQRELSLPIRDDIPLYGVVASDEDTAGLELLIEIGPELLKNDVQLIVHTDARGELIGALEELWDHFPDRLQIRTGRDDAFIHQLIAGADLLLLPIERGDDLLLALAAQRYGTLPIVSKAAPIADALVDIDPAIQSGNAFIFGRLEREELLAVLRRARGAFEYRDRLKRLIQLAMRIEQSQERAAEFHEHLIIELIERGETPAA
ncbi:MAG: hypothetical protein GX614_05630 [Sandaracinaceae bacterium]|nr:hypothetical protein [Sandaracinaceae bacterium]